MIEYYLCQAGAFSLTSFIHSIKFLLHFLRCSFQCSFVRVDKRHEFFIPSVRLFPALQPKKCHYYFIAFYWHFTISRKPITRSSKKLFSQKGKKYIYAYAASFFILTRGDIVELFCGRKDKPKIKKFIWVFIFIKNNRREWWQVSLLSEKWQNVAMFLALTISYTDTPWKYWNSEPK